MEERAEGEEEGAGEVRGGAPETGAPVPASSAHLGAVSLPPPSDVGGACVWMCGCGVVGGVGVCLCGVGDVGDVGGMGCRGVGCVGGVGVWGACGGLGV